MQGTVKFFHNRDNYGFIEVDEQDDDVFFHVTDLEADSVEEGDEVDFETEEGDKGPKAVNVTKV